MNKLIIIVAIAVSHSCTQTPKTIDSQKIINVTNEKNNSNPIISFLPKLPREDDGLCYNIFSSNENNFSKHEYIYVSYCVEDEAFLNINGVTEKFIIKKSYVETGHIEVGENNQYTFTIEIQEVQEELSKIAKGTIKITDNKTGKTTSQLFYGQCFANE